MLSLKKEIREAIIEHAQREYPKEACGILAGRIDQRSPVKVYQITRIYKMANVSENPQTCYFIEPKEQLRVFKEMRHQELELVGIYLLLILQ
jgi:proteasome lid subunit RPN8/RPN11